MKRLPVRRHINPKPIHGVSREKTVCRRSTMGVDIGHVISRRSVSAVKSCFGGERREIYLEEILWIQIEKAVHPPARVLQR